MSGNFCDRKAVISDIVKSETLKLFFAVSFFSILWSAQSMNFDGRFFLKYGENSEILGKIPEIAISYH